MGELSDRELIRVLGPVGPAFFGRFEELREIQRQAIAPIVSGQDVLISSATASGKTEAVLAPMIYRCRQLPMPSAPEIVLLIVAPTRALVNDLYVRLETPLGRLGLTLGRQTSDHRGKSSRPTILITTPESFDSMLVRGGDYTQGRLTSHILEGVRAVFVDEAHLFDCSPRGDQLTWLLERLRRIRGRSGTEATGNTTRLQLCGASATVTDPPGLASRLLGPEAIALVVAGKREIEVHSRSPARAWIPLDRKSTPSELREELYLSEDPDGMLAVGDRLWDALSREGPEQMRKALVFVPTRSMCDRLTSHLSQRLGLRRDILVCGHHGSLARSAREDAEHNFTRTRDAVLVATTTLEVGVDIGDVDLVVLVGAPPSTRSMLQRIGRAGRRIGTTRVLAVPRNHVEQAALASMLMAARDGRLEPETYARRWSVFVQQVASLIAQTRERGRTRKNILSLAETIWPERDGRTANEILDYLVEQRHIVERHARLFLGDSWADAFAATGMHANFDTSSPGWPVVDASTGQVIAHVASPPATGAGIPLGGRIWDAKLSSGEIVLTQSDQKTIGEAFRYSARGGPMSHEYAAHVRRGLGLGEHAAPIWEGEGGPIWWHFGGSSYQEVLRNLFPNLQPLKGFTGIALYGRVKSNSLHSAAQDERSLNQELMAVASHIESTLDLGPYHRYLPDTCRIEVVQSQLDFTRLQNWLNSRDLSALDPSDASQDVINGLFNSSS